jgi:D-alanyl-lipoteichoic acid acyltransferase DltB (MBOAT superfamily)
MAPHQKAKLIYLTIFSFYFYYKSSGWFVSLLLYTAVLDFSMAKLLYKQDSEKRKKLIVTISVILNLLLLGYFKYTYFISGILGQGIGKTFDLPEIILPVGISFFTFQSISYIIDVYRKDIEPVESFVEYLFFISFFPQLVAGPIVRAKDFIPQIKKPYALTDIAFGEGFYLILSGLLKKMVISDYISINFVDRIFENPALYTGFENLMAVYGYALQIYCDFSGYTDMAIGIALWLGYRLPLNFNHPYKALNITDFWRRWHISLSSWLKDYLYIPLGGNRHGKLRQYFNLFITMVLGGLWHGASLNFLIWGALHGTGLTVHKLMEPKLKQLPFQSDFLSGLITFHFVCFCWIFFRASDISEVETVLKQIFTAFHFEIIPQVVTAYKWIFLLMVIGFGIHFLSDSFKTKLRDIANQTPLLVKLSMLIVAIIFIGQIKSSEVQPFIYFQF